MYEQKRKAVAGEKEFLITVAYCRFFFFVSSKRTEASRVTQLCCNFHFFIPCTRHERPPLQNKRVGVLRTALPDFPETVPYFTGILRNFSTMARTRRHFVGLEKIMLFEISSVDCFSMRCDFTHFHLF